MARLSSALRGHVAMLLFSALVAGSFSLGTRVANDLAPPALNALRFMLAALVIGAAAGWLHGQQRRDGTRLMDKGRPEASVRTVDAEESRDRAMNDPGEHSNDAWSRRLVRRSGRAFQSPWRYLILGGLLAVYFVLMFEGLKTTAPVSAAAVFTLTPILSAGFGWLLLRQRTDPRIALALAIGGAGALWVIFRADWAALLRFEIGRGEVLYFYGCVAHALYTPLVPKLNRGEPPVVFSFGTLVAGSFILLIWAAPDLVATDWAALPVLVWIAIGYLAIFATGITFVLLQFAALRLPASKVMAYTYLIPSWVICWEISMGGALPPVWVLAGVLLTILALGLLLEDSQD